MKMQSTLDVLVVGGISRRVDVSIHGMRQVCILHAHFSRDPAVIHAERAGRMDWSRSFIKIKTSSLILSKCEDGLTAGIDLSKDVEVCFESTLVWSGHSWSRCSEVQSSVVILAREYAPRTRLSTSVVWPALKRLREIGRHCSFQRLIS